LPNITSDMEDSNPAPAITTISARESFSEADAAINLAG